jgi:hypothetical protein
MRFRLAVTLALVMSLAGCTNEFSTFEGYLRIAGPVMIQLVDLIALAKGTVPNAALIKKINEDQAAANALAASIQAANALPGTAAPICQQLNLAVSTFAGDLSAIETLGQVSDPKTQETYTVALGIAEAAIQEIEVPIASCATAVPAVAKAQLKVAAATVTSPSDVVAKFNAAVDKKHQVHLHSAAVRYLTLGAAK